MHYILTHPFLSLIAPGSAFIPIIVGVCYYRYLSKASVIMFWYQIFGTVTEVVIGIMAALYKSNLLLLPFYTVIEFGFFSAFFISVFNKRGLINAVKIVGVVFTVLCIINAAFFQHLGQFNTYTRSLEAFLIIVYCLLFFDQESRIRQTIRWEKKPANWIVTGTLAYFAGAFFLFLFSNVIHFKVSRPTILMLWDIHGGILILMDILVAVAFLNERNSR